MSLIKKIPVYIILFFALVRCNQSNEPIPIEKVEEAFVNQMTFTHKGINDTITFYASMNGYIENEVVFRGSGKNLNNTLMLTFKLRDNGQTEINREMTGYWDLGLCIPFNKYLVTRNESNYISIDSFDRINFIVIGKFNLEFVFEKDSTIIESFGNGEFKAKIDTSYVFEYCIEG